MEAQSSQSESAMAASHHQDVTTRKLVADIRTLMADSQELLKASVGLTDERMARLRPKVEESMRQVSTRLAEVQMVQRARESARAADLYVQDHPWKAVGVSVLAGAIIGMLIGRR